MALKKKFKTTNSTKGQGLVEYLIIVALMGVAAIGVIRVLGQNLTAKYGEIANAIQGNSKAKLRTEKVEENHYKKRDLSNFISGATGRKGDAESGSVESD